MIDTANATLIQQFKTKLLLGLSKSPLVEPVSAAEDSQTKALNNLAIIGIRERLISNQSTAINAVATFSLDCSRPFLSAQQRLLLARVFNDKSISPEHPIARATFAALRKYGVALHPFDFSRFESLVIKYQEQIGSNAVHWCSLQSTRKSAEPVVYYQGEVNNHTIAQASKAQKVSYVRQLRLEHADQALQLIEQLAAKEPANIRLDLVGILSLRLSQSDRTFLESLHNDRSAPVRELATQLLGTIAGTEAFAKRLERIKEAITIETEGLFKKKKVFKLSTFVKGNQDEILTQLNALLTGVRLDDLAVLFGESADSLLSIAASTKDAHNIPFFLVIQAVKEGYLHLVERYPSLIDASDLHQMKQLLVQGMPALNAQDQTTLLKLAAKPSLWKTASNIHYFDAVFSNIDACFSVEAANEVLDLCQQLHASNPDGSTAELTRCFVTMAPLIPVEVSPRFLALVEHNSRSASAFHHLLTALARGHGTKNDAQLNQYNAQPNRSTN